MQSPCAAFSSNVLYPNPMRTTLARGSDTPGSASASTVRASASRRRPFSHAETLVHSCPPHTRRTVRSSGALMYACAYATTASGTSADEESTSTSTSVGSGNTQVESSRTRVQSAPAAVIPRSGRTLASPGPDRWSRVRGSSSASLGNAVEMSHRSIAIRSWAGAGSAPAQPNSIRPAHTTFIGAPCSPPRLNVPPPGCP